MEVFSHHTGLVVPLNRENIDTDLIIPKQFLKSIKKTGFGPNLFDTLRYLDHGEPDMDNSTRKINPDFILNKKRYLGASILLTRKNFGCGSSREHAPWALLQFGFHVILAPSYADIFFNNSFKNGLLPIILSEEDIDKFFIRVENKPGYRLTIDLNEQIIIYDKEKQLNFNIEPFRKHCLINGLDEISLTLQKKEKIKLYEKNRIFQKPWLDYK